MNRSNFRFTWMASVAVLAVTALYGCSEETGVVPTIPVDGATDAPIDVRPSAGGADAGRDAADGQAGPVADGGSRDASDGGAGDGATSTGLTAARVAEIRTCMALRWGAAASRAAGDVADDFDACSTAAENTGARASANFVQTLNGWAEAVPNDPSRMRRVTPQDH